MTDIEKWDIVIDLPMPPSVNRFTAKLGNRSPAVREWMKAADAAYIMQTRQGRPQKIVGQFEVHITWCKDSKADWDNPTKSVMDYLERLELIENDRLCRRGLVDFGDIPSGCRIRLRKFRC